VDTLDDPEGIRKIAAPIDKTHLVIEDTEVLLRAVLFEVESHDSGTACTCQVKALDAAVCLYCACVECCRNDCWGECTR
jgi:hypothetical protein